MHSEPQGFVFFLKTDISAKTILNIFIYIYK